MVPAGTHVLADLQFLSRAQARPAKVAGFQLKNGFRLEKSGASGRKVRKT